MKLNKIFIISLFLLAIIAMGSISASEDISDDATTAIEPTDEAINQAVEQPEPTDEAINQAVEQPEPTDEIISEVVEEAEQNEEIISETVNDMEIEENTDSNEALTDIKDEFYIEIFNEGYLTRDNIIYLSSDSERSGTIKFYVNGELANETDVRNGEFNGRWGYDDYTYIYPNDLKITAEGTYAIKVSFLEEGAQTETVLGTANVALSKRPDFEANIYSSFHYPSSTVINFYSNCDKNGTIKIYVNDELVNETAVIDGNFSTSYGNSSFKYLEAYHLKISEYGNYKLKITFTDKVTQNVTVVNESKVIYSDFDVVLFDNIAESFDELGYLHTYSSRNGTMNIFVDGNLKLNYTVENGKFVRGSYEISEYLYINTDSLSLSNGLYNINVTFKDKDTGKEMTLAEKSVAVIIPTFGDITRYIGVDEVFNLHIKFPNIKSGNVTIYVYDNYVKGQKISSAKIINEVATVKISGLNQNQGHQLLISYSTNIGEGNRTIDIITLENVGNVAVSVPSETIVGNDPIVTLKTNTVGNLYVSVDEKLFEFVDVQSLKFIIPNLAPGTHDIRVLFFGNYKGYNSTLGRDVFEVNFIKSYKLTVKGKVVISASKVSATYNSAAKTLSVTLKDANKKVLAKKTITITLNGKTYKATTNAKGIATIKVPTKLVPKTYTATIKFAGDANYAAASLKAKVVVNKAKAKLTAAKKTFKVKATKKVKATLKNNKGKVMKKVKLTLKIGKKTYTAKTNKKGVATFKVKLTKKGKYTGKVKFAGTKYFKAASKKLKITVK